MGEAITRHSLRSLCFRGRDNWQDPDAIRAAGMRLDVVWAVSKLNRDERGLSWTPSLRAQRSNPSLNAKKDWIASLRSQ
jgi:hypothetical protein